MPAEAEIRGRQATIIFRRINEPAFVPLSEAVPEIAEHVQAFKGLTVLRSIENTRTEIARLEKEIIDANEFLAEAAAEYKEAAASGDAKLARELQPNVTASNWENQDREGALSTCREMLTSLYDDAEAAHQNARTALRAEGFERYNAEVTAIKEEAARLLSPLLDRLLRALDSRTRAQVASLPALEDFAGPKPIAVGIPNAE